MDDQHTETVVPLPDSRIVSSQSPFRGTQEVLPNNGGGVRAMPERAAHATDKSSGRGAEPPAAGPKPPKKHFLTPERFVKLRVELFVPLIVGLIAFGGSSVLYFDGLFDGVEDDYNALDKELAMTSQRLLQVEERLRKAIGDGNADHTRWQKDFAVSVEDSFSELCVALKGVYDHTHHVCDINGHQVKSELPQP